MNELKLVVENGKLVADSREVAEMIGKDHAHLCRDIAGYVEVIRQNPKLDSDSNNPKLDSSSGNTSILRDDRVWIRRGNGLLLKNERKYRRPSGIRSSYDHRNGQRNLHASTILAAKV